MMVDPLIPIFIRIGFALLFALAAVHKLRDIQGFKTVISNYNIVPQKLIPVFSFGLPLLEMAVAGLLIFAPMPGVLGGATLLSFYALIIAFNIVRGHVHIDCGCSWGSKEGAEKSKSSTLKWTLVLRNVMLVTVLALALMPAGLRPLGMVDGMNLVLGLGFAIAALKAAGVLISVRRRMQEFGHV